MLPNSRKIQISPITTGVKETERCGQKKAVYADKA